MYDHIFYKQVQISRSDIRPHIKWAVSLVILHMVTSIFLQGLCGYIWVNILTLSPRRGSVWENYIYSRMLLQSNQSSCFSTSFLCMLQAEAIRISECVTGGGKENMEEEKH